MKTNTVTFTAIHDIKNENALFDKPSKFKKYLELRVKAGDKLAKRYRKEWKNVIFYVGFWMIIL